MQYDNFLPFTVRNSIVLHMQRDEQIEACGWITLSPDGEYSYVERQNVHETPHDMFTFSRADSSQLSLDPTIVAYVHTHPRGPCWPSMHDMAVQIDVGKPSVIAARDAKSGIIDIFSFGDHLLDWPLNKRPFRTCVMDCYEAIRAWKWQNEKEKTTAFPRPDGWWGGWKAEDYIKPSANIYEDNFQKLGYKRFEPDFKNSLSDLHPARGDVILMQLGSEVCNHAAAYVGNNEIYHHRIGHLSGNSPLGAYMANHYCKMWLRKADRL